MRKYMAKVLYFQGDGSLAAKTFEDEVESGQQLLEKVEKKMKDNGYRLLSIYIFVWSGLIRNYGSDGNAV